MLTVIGFTALVAAVAGAIGYNWGQRVVITADYTESYLRRLREAGERVRDVDLCGVSYYGSPGCEPLDEVRALVRLAQSAADAHPHAPGGGEP